jgi:hypothetical protein
VTGGVITDITAVNINIRPNVTAIKYLRILIKNYYDLSPPISSTYSLKTRFSSFQPYVDNWKEQI